MSSSRAERPSDSRRAHSATSYSSTRRTALILVGEGTGGAYLAGALKALEAAGVRFDLVLGKGAGVLTAAFSAIQATDKLYGPGGLIEILSRRKPWRLRPSVATALVCLGASFAVFMAPALIGLLLLVTLPIVAAARILLPDWMATVYATVERLGAEIGTEVDPLYLRAMAFPLAVMFAVALLAWILPGALGRRQSRRGATRWLGEGLVDLAPLAAVLEKTLWRAVRGVSVETRPARTKEIGAHYRDLLVASLGQQGFRELVVYALDLDCGQEVPFFLVKDRWRSKMMSRGPGQGAVLAEPVDLGGEGGELLFEALLAASSPPALSPSVPLKLPAGGRHGGEVHRFAASGLAGQSLVADAVAVGAEQILYVSSVPAAAGIAESATDLERLAAASVRGALEADLRWAQEQLPSVPVFVVRPEKSLLGALEFAGRRLPGDERLDLGAVVAQGERDTLRLFVKPIVGESGELGLGAPAASEASQRVSVAGAADADAWGEGPQEL